MTGKRQELKVESDGRVFVEGIRVASIAWSGGDLVLQFDDKNKYRSVDRGTRKLEIAVGELLSAVKQVDK
jgi:hypothetical protein